MNIRKAIDLLRLLAAALMLAYGRSGTLKAAQAAQMSAANGAMEATAAAAAQADWTGVVMLIAGGDVGGRLLHLVPNASFVSSTDAAQIYEPGAGRFELTAGRLHESRERATATLLPSGKILIAGGLKCVNGLFGSRCTALDTAELYDPLTRKFALAGAGSGYKLASARAGHSATLIRGCHCAADGKVLLAGGINRSVNTSFRGIISSPPIDTAELYDPASDRFALIAARMTNKRQSHCAALLSDGRVLLAGGDDRGFFERALATAEVYDPKASSFVAVGAMATARELARATVLDPEVVKGRLAGDVLVSGGLIASDRLMGDSVSTAELFDPRTGHFIWVDSRMSSARISHAAVLLTSGPLAGMVLIAGGLQLRGDGSPRSVRQISQVSADIYDPAIGSTGEFRRTGELNEARGGHAFALLAGGPNAGEVLVAGGENCDGKNPSFCYVAGSPEDRAARNPGVGAELYDPTIGAWSPLRAAMPVPVSAAAYGAVAR
jgi:hypothetical protein